MSTTTLLVRKNHLPSTALQTRADSPLVDGQVRCRIKRFALTSNNITYAAFGDAMNYWQFFPVVDAVPDGTAADWGCIPVWGFADVLQSLHPGVAVGERLYGYWPMASQAVLQPARLSAASFSDAAPHRAALHAVYNQYLRCSADPFYSADTEDLQALLRPLYLTAWLIDDFLADQQYFGSIAAAGGRRPAMLLSSASSKTAYATAARLTLRPEIEVIGLTSPGNMAFCESLGVYHRVISYDQLDTLAADRPCIYVDFAGNGALRLALHSRFTALAYSCSIGGTHVEHLTGARDLPGPRATLFFAPAQVKKRSADWGGAEFNRRLVADWHLFRAQVCNPAEPWLLVQQHVGAAAVQQAYATVLGGKGDARQGHMLAFEETR
jgi:hypothetical protein